MIWDIIHDVCFIVGAVTLAVLAIGGPIFLTLIH